LKILEQSVEVGAQFSLKTQIISSYSICWFCIEELLRNVAESNKKYTLIQKRRSQIMRQMVNPKTVPQQRALRHSHVQKFDNVLACGEKKGVSEKSALLLGDQSDEHCRR
jgi:hypothetical protein